MAAPKRTKFERERDLEIVTRMYCKGVTQREIAERLGVTREQIHYDIKQLFKRWREAEIPLITELKQRELTKIDNLEFEAWESFEKSKRTYEQNTEKTVEETLGLPDGNGESLPLNVKTTTQRITREQCGDPRFLDVAMRCVAKRCEIIGLDAPVKHEDVTPPRPYQRMTKEEIEAEMTAILKKESILGLGNTGQADRLN